MGAVKFIEHKGKKILHVDFSKCSEEEVMRLIEEGKKMGLDGVIHYERLYQF